MSRIIRTAGLVFFVLLRPAAASAAETVGVDFSQDQGRVTRRASGFLHAMSPQQPPAELIEPLRPQLFRINAHAWDVRGGARFATYERARALGARVQLALGDSHGCAQDGPCPGDNGDWASWDDVVDVTVKAAVARGYRMDWDVWNEPDLAVFWSRGEERYLQMWARTVRRIRAVDSAAVLVGPSLSRFDSAFLERFIAFGRDNAVLPDVLSWHEFGDHRSVPENVEQARHLLRRAGVRLQRITINEIIGPEHQTRPGTAALYFAALEKAQVEGACRACWGDEAPGVFNCFNQSLDGILTHEDRRPRSVWWAHRAYAGISGRLVRVSGSPTVDGVAGFHPGARTGRVLLGRDGGAGVPVEVVLSGLDVLAPAQRVRVTAERIADSGWKASPGPLKCLDVEMRPDAGRVRVLLSEFGPSDAFSLTVQPAD